MYSEKTQKMILKPGDRKRTMYLKGFNYITNFFIKTTGDIVLKIYDHNKLLLRVYYSPDTDQTTSCYSEFINGENLKIKISRKIKDSCSIYVSGIRVKDA